MFSDRIKAKFLENKLLKRTITSLFFAPLVLCSVYLGGVIYFVMMLAFLLIGCYELVRMAKKVDKKHHSLWYIVFSLSVLILFLFTFNMIHIRYHSFEKTLFLLLLVWITDTAAYFFGITIGGRKLAPKLSPGKTLAGFLGAIFCSGLVGYICHTITFVKISESIIFTVSVAIAVSIVSQIGDLAESALKRYFGAKDSGNIIPGHGGILDRIDGLIFASFVMVLLVYH